MTRCLRDKTLLRLLEGNGSERERSHLESCEACSERYSQMRRDLDLIKHALEQDPPPSALRFPQMLPFFRWMPTAAALAVGITLGWGGSKLWRADSSVFAPAAFNIELSQFLDEVSRAVVAGMNVRTASAASSDSDFVFLQVALGESCSYECGEFYFKSPVETRGGSPPKDRSHRGIRHKVEKEKRITFLTLSGK
jgi:hypothetical protein